MKPSFVPVLVFSCLPLSAGELPQLTEKPWLGQYAGYEKRSVRFIVDRKGQGQLTPPDGKKGFVNDFNAIRFVPLIEEVRPDGKVFAKAALLDGWEAVTPAAENPEKVTYRGTVKGGARFEATFEIAGGEIRAGGKVIENGDAANPQRFVMRVQFPNLYYREKDEKKRAEKLEEDRLDLLRTDGKKLKLDLATPLDAETAEYSGPGISQARLETQAYKAVKLDLSAGDAGAFELWNKGEAALYQGMSFGWRHDAKKDPEGKGRLMLKMR